MGKTKTAFVGGSSEEESKKPSYDKAAKEAKRIERETAQTESVPHEPKPAHKKPEQKAEKVHITGLKGGQKIKVIGAEPEEVTETQETGEKSAEEKVGHKKIKTRGVNYKKMYARVDRNKLYSIADAIKLVKEVNFAKFDAAMELHIVVKKQGLSFNITLPYSAGKVKRVEIADDKTLVKLSGGKVDFDVLLATADMMPKLVPFAKILGPRGLMPNPKTGTLIKDKKEAEKFSGNNTTLKTEKEGPVIHTVAGKISQKNEELETNIKAILEAIGSALLSKVYLKSTMSPSVKVQV